MKTTIAVIGVGWWGTNIVRTLKAMGINVLCYDISAEQLVKIKSAFDVDITHQLETIWDDQNVLGVCIASSLDTHYMLSKHAMMHGKHVMVEKPPVMSMQEMEELHDLAMRTGRVYLLDALFIYSPAVQRIKSLLESGYFNTIKSCVVYLIIANYYQCYI